MQLTSKIDLLISQIKEETALPVYAEKTALLKATDKLCSSLETLKKKTVDIDMVSDFVMLTKDLTASFDEASMEAVAELVDKCGAAYKGLTEEQKLLLDTASYEALIKEVKAAIKSHKDNIKASKQFDEKVGTNIDAIKEMLANVKSSYAALTDAQKSRLSKDYTKIFNELEEAITAYNNAPSQEEALENEPVNEPVKDVLESVVVEQDKNEQDNQAKEDIVPVAADEVVESEAAVTAETADSAGGLEKLNVILEGLPSDIYEKGLDEVIDNIQQADLLLAGISTEEKDSISEVLISRLETLREECKSAEKVRAFNKLAATLVSDIGPGNILKAVNTVNNIADAFNKLDSNQIELLDADYAQVLLDENLRIAEVFENMMSDISDGINADNAESSAVVVKRLNAVFVALKKEQRALLPPESETQLEEANIAVPIAFVELIDQVYALLEIQDKQEAKKVLLRAAKIYSIMDDAQKIILEKDYSEVLADLESRV